jgi:hypothetical protein
MSMVFYSHYWFVALDDPLYATGEDKRPADWAEQCAKEWVAEEPEARSIVRSCGWAAEVREAFKDRPPRFRDFPGVLVAHCGVDSDSPTSLTLGVAAFNEFVGKDFDKEKQ